MRKRRQSRTCIRASRRDFLVAGGTIASGVSFAAHAWPDDSNDRIEIAVIGVGARGKYLISNLPAAFRVTAVCDFSTDQLATALQPAGRFRQILKLFAEGDGRDCKIYQDYRVMLGQQNFDAVIIATPDHHHAQAAILAMQAGADVYLEKPISVTIAEGRAIAEAANKYQRVVQVGSQQRTMQVNRDACEFIRDGGLGKISLVEDRNLPGPMPHQATDFPAQPIPADIDWDLFCGPAELRPYHRQLWIKDAFKVGDLIWRGWDLFDDYSGHLMTNWGAHSVDMIQYALGMDDSGPEKIDVFPGKIDQNIDDQWLEKTPPLGSVKDPERDRMRFCPVEMLYANGTRLRFAPGVRKTVFHGEKGSLYLSRNDYRTDPVGLLPDPDPIERSRWEGSGHVARPHLENFLEAIRQRSTPNAMIEVGHRSITVCHLANIARRLRRTLHWDPRAEEFVDDDQANQHLSRTRRAGFELPKTN